MRPTITLLMFSLACTGKSEDSALEIEDTGSVDTQDTENTESDNTDTEESDSDDTDIENTDPVDSISDYSIDSTDSGVWVYFSLDDGDLVSPTSPENSSEWDLKFQRYVIGINGGASGSAGVQVMIQEGTYSSYSDITTVPTDGVWISDEADSNADGNPEYAFADWYNYDPSNHTLSPKEYVYFIQNASGTYKMRIIDYYNSDGESGHISFDAELIE
ncbi:MAG: HmuY family protein [Myxococcota bacterium]